MTCVLLVGGVVPLFGQAAGPRDFPPGAVRGSDDLPPGRLRWQIERLPAAARERAVAWLGSFHFTEQDLNTLQVDPEGGIFYADTFTLAGEALADRAEPPVAAASVPVSPFPAHLRLHSRPGAPNVLYLNFSGETVTGTAWNSSLGRTSIPAVAFSTDGDYATFSDSEQTAIKGIWQRMAEDYAPFNIDVTTERPATFTTRTAHALITRSTDANGAANPSSSGGGVAYVNVFGSAGYANYRPAWIYANNLAGDESYMAEAASHEIGHNLGLSHDGRTDGMDYYGGHGSGDTSWGPIMGTGYNRNVSQWSKGEYYLANNKEDDLAIIAGKITYRADDHGNTVATASALKITEGTNVWATTPENDPAGANSANKGTLERNTDLDVFSFATGSGSVDLMVKPWVMPAGITLGGNLDLSIELFDSMGTLLLADNAPGLTYARIQTNLAEGVYYLQVKNSGAGSPTNTSPNGYTSYGSIGQYFITGRVVSSAAAIPPGATLAATNFSQQGAGSLQFTVTYTDDRAVSVASLDSSDLLVTSTNGYAQFATLVAIDAATDGTPRKATYGVSPQGGQVWSRSDNGVYSVLMRTNQVLDTEGVPVPAGPIGEFQINIPHQLYLADMESNPGWLLEGQWEYGIPLYPTGTGPGSGFTGNKILGFNLSGHYPNRLNTTYATTTRINGAGSTALTLRFRRWLRLRSSDTAVIQVSTNGTDWSDVWRTTSAVSDTAWQPVQYSLPEWTINCPAIQLRWGLASSPSQTEIGWNIDDVELLGDGNVDTAPPIAMLNVGDVVNAGAPTHSLTVTYLDDTAVRVSSLGASNLVVRGPNGYSNLLEFAGVDVATDGTPRVASYTVVAPGGLWDASDNGTYEIMIQAGEVTDVLNNATAEAVLGTFSVVINTNAEVLLQVSVNREGWGAVTPSGGTFRAGDIVQLSAAPTDYYRFTGWTGGVNSTNNPVTLVIESNMTVQANFAEQVTTNHLVPYWWLATAGHTENFETAELNTGSNGMPLWQSFIAGLNPNDPTSQLRLSVETSALQGSHVLRWQTVTGRVYTVWQSTDLMSVFSAVPGASNLPPSIRALTNEVNGGRFYRLEVTKQ